MYEQVIQELKNSGKEDLEIKDIIIKKIREDFKIESLEGNKFLDPLSYENGV